MDRVVDVMGLIAGLGGLAVVALAWPRRRAGSVRRRHPSAGTPFSVALGPTDPVWRFSVRSGRPAVTIDIVTHRPAGTSQWIGEPFIDPVIVEAGTTASIPASVGDPSAAHDVVIAWTVLNTAGHVQGSRAMRVGAPALEVPVVPADGSGRGAQVAFGAIGMFLALTTMVLGLRLLDDRTHDRSESISGAPTTSMPRSTTVAQPPPHTSVAASTTSHTDVPPPTPPTTTPASTATTSPVDATDDSTVTTAVTATSTSTLTTTTTTTTTTTATATTTATSTTPPSTPPSGPRVEIEARIEDCRFGADCVIASFTVVEFEGSGEYVCEFDDGTRFTFRYDGSGAQDACATSGPNPSITIEVDGIRSLTVTRERLDGA